MQADGYLRAFYPFILSLFRQAVASVPDFILIIDAGNRRTPVCNHNIRLIAKDTVLSDINLLLPVHLLVQIVDSAKIGIVICRPVFPKLIGSMFFQTCASHHLIVQLHVAALHRLEELLRLFVPFLKFCLIFFCILQNQSTALVEVLMFLLVLVVAFFLLFFAHGVKPPCGG